MSMKGALIDDLKIQNLRGERTINDAAKYNSKEKTGASPYEGIRTCL